MKKYYSICAIALVSACSSGTPKCDDSGIKKALVENVKSTIAKDFKTDKISVKMSAISSTGSDDNKRSCEADITLKITDAKYTTKSTATLGTE